MEESRPPFEETSDEVKSSRKKRKAGERLFNLAEYLNPERYRKPESTDDDEETDTPTESRFQKAWKAFFKRQAPVEKQEPQPANESNESEEDTPVIERPAAEVGETQPILEHPAEVVSDDMKELTEDEPLQIRNEEPRETVIEPDEVLPPTASDVAPEEPEATPTQIEPQQVEPLPTPEYAQAMVSPSASIEQEESRPVQERVVIDRRAGWGPAILTGAIVNRMAKNRERSLKREDQRQERQISELKQRSLERDQNMIKQREQFEQVAKRQFESVRVHQERLEKRLEPEQVPDQKMEKRSVEAPKEARQEKVVMQESSSQQRPEREALIETIESRPEASPLVVLEKVEKAAEKNLAIEDTFEKRHEIKGEDRIKDQGYGAASVAAVLAGIHQRTSDQHAAFSQNFYGNSDEETNPKSSPISYQQAARGGFLSGLFIAVLLVIFLLIR